MATTYPTTVDVLTNPSGTDSLTGHAALHSTINDAIEAIETKLGTTSTPAGLPAGAVVGKTSGVGIKVDTDNPTYGWHDLIGALHARASGASVPTFGAYNATAVYQYSFSNATTQELYVEFHIPHDYAPGSDIYIHAHWSQTTADPGTAVKWSFDSLYAKGHNQQAFPAAVTTVSATQSASSTVRTHMVAETQLSTGGSVGGNALEVDGILLVRVWRNPADAADTLTQVPFLHFVDIHYQSTNMCTKNKAPNFYA